MAVARSQVAPTITQRTPSDDRRLLNAQQVTSIAMAFLKSLGHKRGVKPKRVFIEEQRYVVEAEIGNKILAKVQVDISTSEIKEFSIEKAPEEAPIALPVEPKAIMIMFGISIAVSVVLALLDVQGLLAGLF